MKTISNQYRVENVNKYLVGAAEASPAGEGADGDGLCLKN